MPRATSKDIALLIALAICACLTSSAWAQAPTRLPPIEPSIEYKPGELGGRMVEPFALPGQLTPGQWSPGAAAEGRATPERVAEREEQNQAIMLDEQYPLPAEEAIILDDGTVLAAPSSKKAEGKDGFLQEVALIGSWLPQLEGDSLGLSEASISMTGGLPFPTRNYPLLITPFFQTMFLDGPVTPDLPPRVYSTYLQFRWLPKLSETWRLDLGVSPGFYSDFKVDAEHAYRLTGRGIVLYTYSERLMIAAGALYLDRPDIDILPVGGIIWTPSDDWKLELIFPKPKIARRLNQYQGMFNEEYWVYVSGEFGGDTWFFENTSNNIDQFIYRDWRAMLGFQRKVIGGISTHIEFGYVFNRRVEYTSNIPDYEPGDTIMLRAGAVY
jgi:hypothetical protein